MQVLFYRNQTLDKQKIELLVEIVFDVDVRIEEVLPVRTHIDLIQNQILEGLLQIGLADQQRSLDSSILQNQLHILQPFFELLKFV